MKKENIFRLIENSRLKQIAFIGMTLFIVPISLILLRGDPMPLIFFSGAIHFVVMTYYWPLVTVFFIMLFSTNVLQFVSLENLPSLKLFSLATLNLQDITVLILLLISVIHLIRNKENPLFLKPIIFIGIMVMTSLILGTISTAITLKIGINGLRNISGLLFYLGLVGTINSKRKLQGLIGILCGFTVISVVIQVIETISGNRIAFGNLISNVNYSTTQYIQSGSIQIPYLWNRASGYLFLGLLVALGASLRKRELRYWLWAGVALVGVALAFVRQWYIMVGVSSISLLWLLRQKKSNLISAILVVGALLLGVLVIVDSNKTTNYSVGTAVLSRVLTLGQFQEQASFTARVSVWGELIALLKQYPFFGYGPGGSNQIDLSQGSISDTGIINTMFQYGIFGTLAFLALIAANLRQCFALFKGSPGLLEQGISGGLFSLWIGVCVGYSFSTDFFTFGELTFTVGLAMALLDRLSKFYLSNTTNEQRQSIN